ncbi:MAG: hypothetical protein RBS34_02820 [Desulfofustis sp.]|jgi:hypothetical protein|nr:hypothetical protein [Desulfofustis sp.]
MPADIELRAGDLFCVRSAGLLSFAILAVERFNAKDDRAEFGHSGVIVDALGSTFEALATLRYGSLDRYRGKHVLIARPVLKVSRSPVQRYDRQAAINRVIREHQGQIYPFWRIPLHLVPPASKYLSVAGRWLVCSEVVAKTESYMGVLSGPYAGRNPDDLADRWRLSWTHQVLFDGVW